jgi:hypothetical protein
LYRFGQVTFAKKNILMKIKIVLLSAFLGCLTNISAQRFQGNLIGGLQSSDLTGEQTLGYQFGVQGLYNFSEKFAAGVELLATQNGDYFNDFPKGLDYDKARLSFVEIPIQAVYALVKDEKKDFYRIRFYGGATYSYLYNYKLSTVSLGDISNLVDLPKFAIVPHFGVVGFFTPRVGIDFRSALALNGEFTLAFRGLFII